MVKTMYWTNGTNRIAVPTIPFYTLGNNEDFTLTFVTESGESLSDVYLFVYPSTNLEGLVQAKLSTQSSYSSIMGPLDASCYLGDIAESTETDIDFRISIAESAGDAYRIFHLFIGHGIGSTRRSTLFESIALQPLYDSIANQALFKGVGE